MDTLTKIVIYLLVLSAAVMIEVFCAGANSQSLPPFNATSNAWPALGRQNAYPVNPVWVNSGTTTPWPQLGQSRRNSNQNPPRWVQPNTQSPNTQNGPQFPPPGSRTTTSSSSRKQQQQSQAQDPNDVQDNELKDFSESLLQRDVNNAARFVTINYQGKTTSGSKNDEAPQPLLAIQKDVFNIPTISKLVLLHNNYIVETHVNEHVSAQEREEENNLLDALLSTPVMQLTRNFLISKGKIGRDPREFRDRLKEMWFNMYSRGGGRIGSSGFEHIFLAEIKNQTVSGLHNWIYFNEEEAKKKANYLGYLKKVELGNNFGLDRVVFVDKHPALSGLMCLAPCELEQEFHMGAQTATRRNLPILVLNVLNQHEPPKSMAIAWILDRVQKVQDTLRQRMLGVDPQIIRGKGAILKYHFKFHDLDKPVGSMFIGTSPELEIALYSTCFILRANRVCPLRLAGNNFIIRTYSYRYRGKDLIGSAFPEI